MSMVGAKALSSQNAMRMTQLTTNHTKTSGVTAKKGKRSGWDPEAGKVFNKHCKHIHKLCKADRKNGWKKWNTALELVCAHHAVTKQTHSKKHHCKEVTPAADKMEWEDEVDHWSAGSDEETVEEEEDDDDEWDELCGPNAKLHGF